MAPPLVPRVPVLAALAAGLGGAALAAACALGQGREDGRTFIRTPVPLDAMEAEARGSFLAGREIFAKRWTAQDGLGPLMDGQSCVICHPRGGHGRPASLDRPPADNASMIVRIPPGSAYGEQMQRRTPQADTGEGKLALAWREAPFVFPDGTGVSLRTPHYSLMGLALGPAPDAVTVMIAPKLAGAAQLDAVPDDQILALADPEDLDGNGISGRPALTPDGRLGRFGWRAEVATLSDQAARAFALDMGLSTPAYLDANGDCLTPVCRDAFGSAAREAPEVSPQDFAALMDFLQTMEPPAPSPPARDGRGAAQFVSLGCARCHQPRFVTGEAPQARNAYREIAPYTDLLLHDMGLGLASGVSAEWRTAPLWGAVLRRQVHGEEFYLHDGRARSLTEAILWHGGEARAARDGFAALSAPDRAALLAFLETL